MNLTITQAIERTKDLSGELKAARTALLDCAADVEAKDRMAEIARKALTNAEEHEARLMAERDELADHIAALVRKTGDTPPLAENGPDDQVECIETTTPWVHDFTCATNQAGNADGLCTCSGQGLVAAPNDDASAFWNPHPIEGADFQARALENGLARIHDALDRAT